MKTEINILNRPFTLEIIKGKLYDDNDKFQETELDGQTSKNQGWIKISGNISPNTRDETIVHELTHNINDFTLGHKFSDEDQELICYLTANLMMVLRNNGFIPLTFTMPGKTDKN